MLIGGEISSVVKCMQYFLYIFSNVQGRLLLVQQLDYYFTNFNI